MWSNCTGEGDSNEVEPSSNWGSVSRCSTLPGGERELPPDFGSCYCCPVSSSTVCHLCVLVGLVLAGACQKRSSTPPIEPSAEPVGAEAGDADVAPSLVVAESESATEPGAGVELLYAMKSFDACCSHCEFGAACKGCRVLGATEPCGGIEVSCLQGIHELVCTSAPNDDEIWDGLTGTEVGEDYEVGGQGVVEGGEGFGKRGGGSGFGGRGTATPRVRQAQANVEGALDREIVRRIVRAHINEVRTCYDRGLQKDPTLQGRVSVAFEINADGKVGSSTVQSNDLSDASVATCIAEAVERWKFPKPQGGGVVRVAYPFNLSPG